MGERWPTPMVTEFLRTTRQALQKRVVRGSVIGLQGPGTRVFPVWQFDLDAHEVRPVVADSPRASTEIRDNLSARITEAEREGWHGEIEGLKISLAGAHEKLAQIDNRPHPLNVRIPVRQRALAPVAPSTPTAHD